MNGLVLLLGPDFLNIWAHWSILESFVVSWGFYIILKSFPEATQGELDLLNVGLKHRLPIPKSPQVESSGNPIIKSPKVTLWKNKGLRQRYTKKSSGKVPQATLTNLLWYETTIGESDQGNRFFSFCLANHGVFIFDGNTDILQNYFQYASRANFRNILQPPPPPIPILKVKNATGPR